MKKVDVSSVLHEVFDIQKVYCSRNYLAVICMMLNLLQIHLLREYAIFNYLFFKENV